MVYSNTVKFIILGIFLIVISFAIGMAWNLNRSNKKQQSFQSCLNYQQSINEGVVPATRPQCAGQ